MFYLLKKYREPIRMQPTKQLDFFIDRLVEEISNSGLPNNKCVMC